MKKVQPGVHPENEGSKWPNTNAAEWRPDAAFADKQINTTNIQIYNWNDLENQMVGLLMTPRAVQQAHMIFDR